MTAPMATQPLDTAFANLCAKHDVYAFEISLNLRQSDGGRFNCTIHHDGPTKFNGCVMAGGATSGEAMRAALVKLADDRAGQDVPIIGLELVA